MTSVYQIGDYVKIVHDGATYSSYASFFDRIGRPDLKSEFVRSGCKIGWGWNNGDIGQVLAIGTHENESDILYVVRVDDEDGGYLTLISETGIQLEYTQCNEIDEFEMADFLAVLGTS